MRSPALVTLFLVGVTLSIAPPLGATEIISVEANVTFPDPGATVYGDFTSSGVGTYEIYYDMYGWYNSATTQHVRSLVDNLTRSYSSRIETLEPDYHGPDTYVFDIPIWTSYPQDPYPPFVPGAAQATTKAVVLSEKEKATDRHAFTWSP